MPEAPGRVGVMAVPSGFFTTENLTQTMGGSTLNSLNGDG